MVGNNACGLRAFGYGRTAENVVALDAVFPRSGGAAAVARELESLVAGHLAHVRTGFEPVLGR